MRLVHEHDLKEIERPMKVNYESSSQVFHVINITSEEGNVRG